MKGVCCNYMQKTRICFPVLPRLVLPPFPVYVNLYGNAAPPSPSSGERLPDFTTTLQFHYIFVTFWTNLPATLYTGREVLR